MNKMLASDPEALFGDIVAYIEQARTIMVRGEWVELTGLDTQVATLCELVAAMSREQAVEYAPELEFVREQIAILGEEMTRNKDAMRVELKETGVVSRANRAYATVNNLKEPNSGS